MKFPENTFVMALLGVPAQLYGAAVRLRRRGYAALGLARRAGAPVISVGNITVGGTGKTTIVSWLVSALKDRGWRPAVVSRGYLGRAGRGPLFVSRGQGPLVASDVSGDEPFLLASRLHDTVVVAGSDRVLGSRAAIEAGADVVILDDGFQHLRLARDVDLVLLDAHSPFGNYRLLPAGTLREPASALRRAHAVIITRSRPDETFDVLERVVRRYNRTVPILRAGHRCSGFVDPRGVAVERPARAVAFCGIGNPDSFVTDLGHQGVEVVAFRAFRDHHAFTATDRDELVGVAKSHRAVLLTTEKDLVRFPEIPRGEQHVDIVAMRIEAVVHDSEPLLGLIETALGRRPDNT